MTDLDHFYLKLAAVFTAEWRQDSVCYDYPDQPELFFNESFLSDAKSLCDICPVGVECLDDSMYYVDEGVRGGLSEQERISLTLFRKRTAPSFKCDLARPLELYRESQMRFM